VSDEIRVTIGSRLKLAAKEAGLNAADVAVALDVAVQTVYGWAGDSSIPWGWHGMRRW
jgi:transcriptional regulator with XRE-family HTH domain